ncbi:hypothetical protein GCM10009425_31370 [Pseudomonas asuensis]|uniref:Uncharacterized protein n=1 Tax=Pseudomonas asuensis TaxID=1825787 RepID=A0ABQ2GX44_9PSED|nr:hypothetical protein GCM10009425_31370 [Pseudomonas asuensis]
MLYEKLPVRGLLDQCLNSIEAGKSRYNVIEWSYCALAESKFEALAGFA